MQANYSFHHFPSAALSALSTHKPLFIILIVLEREREEKRSAGFAGLGFRHEEKYKTN